VAEPSALKKLVRLEPFPQPPLVNLRYPVVLMHGFGVMAGLQRKGHLHAEALHLRLHGIRAYAPNVAPYHTVPFRAAMWQERLTHILAETRADRLNLVAHSMGGLDARYLISRMGLQAVVAALITVSSPHHGSSLADFVLEQPERIRDLMADVSNWMGTAALAGAEADFLQAVQELRPAYVQEHFNPVVPDAPGVYYGSYAGQAGEGTDSPINPFMRLFNHQIFKREGINDGFVSVASAQWGTFLGTVAADHTQQVGLSLTPRSRFHSKDFYLSIAHLLAQQGF
jgi:triacylglycerol lipase